MNNEQLETVITYKESFVEDYDDWKEVVSTINSNLYDYLDMFDEEDIDTDILDPFTYNEFCSEFIIQLERYFEDFDELTKESINAIFEVIILLRISNTSSTPATVIEQFIV